MSLSMIFAGHVSFQMVALTARGALLRQGALWPHSASILKPNDNGMLHEQGSKRVVLFNTPSSVGPSTHHFRQSKA
jgi:hypothetical protein